MTIAQSTFRAEGVSLLFSFPYWLFIDTEFVPQIKEGALGEFHFRLYPPFRSAPANFVPAPAINPHRIPFLPQFRVSIPPDSELPTLAAIPKFGAGSGAAMLIATGPDFQEELKVFPMDSLRLDVFGGGDEDEVIDQGREFVTQLIQLLRHYSRQWWIEHFTDAGTLRNVFPVNKDGLPVGITPDPYTRGFTASDDVKAIDESLWQKSISDLERGVMIPLYDLLILDARYLAITHNIRRSILDSAVACEQARDVHIERLWNSNAGGAPFKLGRLISGNSLPNHLSKDLEKFVRRSYEKEHYARFAVIEDLWNARGNIAHGRPSQFFRDGQSRAVDADKAKAFSDAAEHCVRWLESL